MVTRLALPSWTSSRWRTVSTVRCQRFARVLLACVWLTCAWWVGGAQAVEQTAPTGQDVRVVIDISGSMKRNDPHNLRIPAVNLLVGLLPQDATAGIWTFGRWVNMLIPHGPATDAWRTDARTRAKEINSVALRTHIGAALDAVARDLSPAAAGRTHVILLTDGWVDLEESDAVNAAERARVLNQVVPRFAEADVAVHTIALSDNADLDLLRKISRATDGLSLIAPDSDALLRLFLQVLEQASPVPEVPLQNNRFTVDASIEEFTVLIMHREAAPLSPVRLRTPDGDTWSSNDHPEGTRWLADRGYTLITVSNPPAGEWHALAPESPDHRVRVVSDLSLEVEGLPTSLTEPASINGAMWLSEHGQVLTDPDLLRITEGRAQLLFGGQALAEARWNAAAPLPDDGRFEYTLAGINAPGQYELLFQVDGGTFSRQLRRYLDLSIPELDALMPVRIDPDAFELQRTPVEGGQLFHLRGEAPALDSATQVQVTGMLYQPGGAAVAVGMAPVQAGPGRREWRLKLTASDLPEAGRYRLAVRIQARAENGAPLNVFPDEARFEHQLPLAPIEPEPEIEVPPPEEAAASGGSLLWVTAGGFALLNLACIGVGFWAYRRFIARRDQEMAASLAAGTTAAGSPADGENEANERAAAASQADESGADPDAGVIELDAETDAEFDEPVDDQAVDELVDEIIRENAGKTE